MLARNLEKVCGFYDERKLEVSSAEPNAAHLALAHHERHWCESSKGRFLLLTQNVDNLHERAGSINLIHLHGELFSAWCVECGYRGPRYGSLEDERECPACEREALRPDVVLFGETPRGRRQIEQALADCDVFVAIGTSGTVYPASSFAGMAKANGAETTLINLEAANDPLAFDSCILGAACQTLPVWVASVTDR